MKIFLKIGFLFCTIILHLNCKSQIVLDINDLPKIGDRQVTRIVDSTEAVSLSPGNAGANVTWDFSTMFFCCIDFNFKYWVDPTWTTHAAEFPDADIALKSNCYVYHDPISHSEYEICDYRNYYIKNTEGLLYYGSDFPNVHILQNYRNVFPLLNYGQTKINHSRNVIQKTTDTILVTSIIDTITTDGWGTLMTPLDTCSALRIYTKETVWDSLYVNGIGQQLAYMPDNYYYKWYTKELGFPVLQISKGILETSKDYQIVRASVSKSNEVYVPENKIIELKSIVFPNPATNEIQIHVKNENTNKSSILLVADPFGKEILKKECKTTDELQISKSEINEGLFFYKVIFNDGSLANGKFIMN